MATNGRSDAPRSGRTGLTDLRLTRRGLLAGSIGAAALVVLPRGLASGPAAAAAAPPPVGPAPAGAQVFLYGIPGPAATPGPSMEAARPSTLRGPGAAAAPAVATRLAALPVKSADQRTLALVTVDESPAGATVMVTLMDVVTAAVAARGSLALHDLPAGAMLLVTPTFAADSATVPLVLSITVPSGVREITKVDPGTGTARRLTTATWTSHHALAYFSRDGAFAGPFHLDDAPSLARVSAVADAGDLFLWTVDEAAAITGRRPAAAAGVWPQPRLAAYPLGSDRARFIVPAPGPWPVSGEPVAVLATGDVARLAYGRQLEVYSPQTGHAIEVGIPALGLTAARPGAPSMQSRPDGTVFVNSPAIGRAVTLDPARSFRTVAVTGYPPPAARAGGPAGKAVLSADGSTLFVLGDAATGGLAAYDVATGRRSSSYSHGEHYTGLHQLGDGTLLAISAASPRLLFFSPALEPLGAADTDLHVAAVL